VKLVTTAQMRQLEQRSAEAGVSTEVLMENAGLAVAQEAWLLLTTLEERRILVLVGPGNNGGDGMVAAWRLHEWGARVEVYTVRRRGPSDRNEARLVESGVPLTAADDDPQFRHLESALAQAELVIDALLGTGVSRPIEGVIAEVLARLRQALNRPFPPQVLAVDLPSGVNADTGAVDPHTAPATVTAALGFAKVGCHMMPALEYCGHESVLDIGLPKDAAADLPIELLDDRWVRQALPRRPNDANKGTFGKLFVIAGSINYVGAPVLCSLGAYRVGAGLVTLGCPASLHAVFAAKLTEATFAPLPDRGTGRLAGDALSAIMQALQGYDIVLIGPGLGADPQTLALVRSLLSHIQDAGIRAVVVDADALNALAQAGDWPQSVRVPLVMTPHPGEMGRLTGRTAREIQLDRLTTVMHYGAAWRQVIVLKGANTVVAGPSGEIALSPFANAALAVAGTGDVLAGAIAGFLCQGLEPFAAAACGVYVHGAAGELARAELGSAGLLASELLPLLPQVMKRLRGERRADAPDLQRQTDPGAAWSAEAR
jgi:NAD(P)H-hydrate epimerase